MGSDAASHLNTHYDFKGCGRNEKTEGSKQR